MTSKGTPGSVDVERPDSGWLGALSMAWEELRASSARARSTRLSPGPCPGFSTSGARSTGVETVRVSIKGDTGCCGDGAATLRAGLILGAAATGVMAATSGVMDAATGEGASMGEGAGDGLRLGWGRPTGGPTGASTRTRTACHGAGDGCRVTSRLCSRTGLSAPPLAVKARPSVLLSSSSSRCSRAGGARPSSLGGSFSSRGEPFRAVRSRSRCTSSQELGRSTSVSGRSGPCGGCSRSASRWRRQLACRSTSRAFIGERLRLRPHFCRPSVSPSLARSCSMMSVAQRKRSSRCFAERRKCRGVSTRCCVSSSSLARGSSLACEPSVPREGAAGVPSRGAEASSAPTPAPGLLQGVGLAANASV